MKYIKNLILIIIVELAAFINIQAQCGAPGTSLVRNLDVSYFQAPFGAVVIKGEYGIWYKTNTLQNPNANRITKPFIICEGFDPGGNNTLPCIYESIDNRVNVDFLRHLRSEGFDIIILNLLTNGIEIEKNAKLFQTIKYKLI